MQQVPEPSEVDPEKQRTRRDVPPVRRVLARTTVAVFVAFVGVLWVQWPLVGAPVVTRLSLRVRTAATAWAEARRRRTDPRIGLLLPAPLGVNATRSRPDEVTLVQFTAPSGACCADASRALAHALRRRFGSDGGGVSLVVIGAPGSTKTDGAANDMPWIEDAPDPAGRLSQAYNAYWRPRAYLLVGGRLAWIQRRREDDADDIARSIAAEIQTRGAKRTGNRSMTYGGTN